MTDREKQFLEKLMLLHSVKLRTKFIEGSATHHDQDFEHMDIETLAEEMYSEALDQLHYAGNLLFKIRELREKKL